MARYRGPSRGAQGNALKTVLGIPFALGVTEPVVIESSGVRHELRVSERGGDVAVSHETSDSDRTMGTSVTVPLPPDLDIDAARWAFGAALVNPDATITAIEHGYDGTDSDTVFYKSTDQSWSTWTPSMPSSPHWYDKAAFAALVYSHIRQTARTGVDVPLGRFISEFDGLSATAKQREISRATKYAARRPITHLSQLDGLDDVIAVLHDAMLQHAKPTPASKLGAVGADHYRRLLDAEYGVQRFWFKTKTVTVDGIPWVIEVAVADTVKPGGPGSREDHGPGFGDPLGRATLTASGIRAHGSSSFLAAAGRRRR